MSLTTTNKHQYVELEHGTLEVFDGRAKHWPWFWKKFRSYCMNEPNFWAILTKKKGRREQLPAHKEAKGDAKNFFPVYDERTTENALTAAQYDKANRELYSIWLQVLTRDAEDLTIGVAEEDGMSITANALSKHARQDAPAKMRICFDVIKAKQGKTEPLEAYTARAKKVCFKRQAI